MIARLERGLARGWTVETRGRALRELRYGKTNAASAEKGETVLFL